MRSGTKSFSQTRVETQCWFNKSTVRWVGLLPLSLLLPKKWELLFRAESSHSTCHHFIAMLSTSSPGYLSGDPYFREWRSLCSWNALSREIPPVLLYCSAAAETQVTCADSERLLIKEKKMTFASGSFTQRYVPESQRKISRVMGSMGDLWRECRKRLVTG